MILLLIRLALINLARNDEVGGWYLRAAAAASSLAADPREGRTVFIFNNYSMPLHAFA